MPTPSRFKLRYDLATFYYQPIVLAVRLESLTYIPMHVIGLLGGIASGKSFVAQRLAALGADLVNADKIAHQVLRRPEVEQAARERWGQKIFDPDGRIDRASLGRIVFGGGPDADRQRQYLESITHPLIREGLQERIEKDRGERKPAVVLDAPLLLEGGWSTLCDILLFVETPMDLRQARAAERGWGKDELAIREQTQVSVDEKRRLADVIIDNAHSPEHTQAQIEHFWRTRVHG